MAEELENPMNVHRWRKLEGSDPASYELIQKVQALQKRLIEKTEDIGPGYKISFFANFQKWFFTLIKSYQRDASPREGENVY